MEPDREDDAVSGVRAALAEAERLSPGSFTDATFWILGPDGETPKEVPFLDGMAWAAVKRSRARVAYDEGEGWSVSTVFVPILGTPGLRPRLFETMTVQGREEEFLKWDTMREAEEGHAAAVSRLRDPSPTPR